ncbi:hypothetical protein DPMN_167751 [Dreissena polymorpha]|uniref:Uncharacterized protein n=1 Tax=Dreissena polymorpha TaxID=45954 RepID=A0A9D4F1F4_DREPO|nr:hypothetical protein DPMN_167751 [Dreissena polymorpha]
MIDSAYRPTQQSRGGRPRPVIVKFQYNKQREMVRKLSFEAEKQQTLKQQNIGIGVQLPKEVRESRKPLYDVMRQAINSGKDARFVGKDLQINGQIYKAGNQERSANQ